MEIVFLNLREKLSLKKTFNVSNIMNYKIVVYKKCEQIFQFPHFVYTVY